MIIALRNMLKTTHVYKIFLWLFLIVLIVGGVSFDFNDNRPWVIKICKEKTNELEFRASVNNKQRQYDYLKAQGFNWPRTESVEKETLRYTIIQMMMKDLGKKLNLKVPSVLVQEQFNNQIEGLPAYFFDEQGRLNIGMFEKVIAPKNFEEFVQDLENGVKSEMLNNLAMISSYVPEFEIAMQLKEEYANKEYSIIKISLDKALHKVKENKVTDETLEKYYKKAEHGDLYKSQEKRAGKYWRFQSKDYGLTVSKDDIANYYDKNKHSEFLETPAQVQVHRIYFEKADNFDAKEQAQITHDQLKQDPSTFAAVAKKIAGAKHAHQGSQKTEFFAKDTKDFDKVLVDTAFEQLEEDNAISEVIKTDKGYEILQRLSRKPAKYKSQSSVSHEIEEKLTEEKFSKRFNQDAERIVGNINYNKQAFHDFVTKKHGTEINIPLDERKMGLHVMKLFQTEQGQFAVFMEGKAGIILECTEIEKRALKPFDAVKSQVREDYYKKLAQEELEVMTSQAMKNAQAGSFDVYAKEHGFEFEKAHAEYKSGQMDQPAVLRRPELAQKIKVLQKPGSTVDVVAATEGFVICLDEIAEIDGNLLREKRSVVQANLVQKAKYKGRESFIASLYRHVKLNNKIEIKEQLLKDIKDAQL